MPSFAVATPTRGLLHSRTVESALAAIATAEAAGHVFLGWRLTHDLPIPDAHNAAADAALATGADAVWFLEEDVVAPCDALLHLFALGTPVAVIDYPVAGGWSCVCHQGMKSGPILYAGLGCTLIARRVFETLERPWFRSDTTFLIQRVANVMQLVPIDKPCAYGGQDIAFSQAVHAAGFTIGQVPGVTAGHCRVEEMGAPRTNAGTHRVSILDAIERIQVV
jgi:hypothetical protein